MLVKLVTRQVSLQTGVTVTYANAVSNEYRQGCPSASIPSDLPPS
ncbi:hypothetical protein [Nostoc commune]|nr:hypothetical protein [Nostoc commune]